MNKELKNILLDTMKKRGVKIPKLSKETGIPKDRIYKWYQEGSSPKPEDSLILEKWINDNRPDVIATDGDQLFIAEAKMQTDTNKDTKIAALENEVLRLKLENLENKLAVMEVSLNGIRANQAYLIALIKEGIKRSAIYRYGSDKKKLQQELEEINSIAGAALNIGV